SQGPGRGAEAAPRRAGAGAGRRRSRRARRLDAGVPRRPEPARDDHPLLIGPAMNPSLIARRTFLTQSAYGLGGLALASLMAKTASAGERWRGVMPTPHVPVRAKRVIHLCMAGGPSQFESFDHKPALRQLHGQPFPESFTRGQQLAQLQNTQLIARGSKFGFRRW